ncbi:hypothetical protein NECAME_06909, partial [Necator americanus]
MFTALKISWNDTKIKINIVGKSRNCDYSSSRPKKDLNLKIFRGLLALITVTEWFGSSGTPIEDEPFYHGYMERKEAERSLTKVGEYIVRKAMIRKNESISDLIRYHQAQKVPIYGNDIILQSFVQREQWQLYHEQVALGSRLGQGEFGDVFLGSLTVGLFTKPIKVAVKTLKEGSLSSDDRITFLREANVMLKLQHKHVVRLYGVATQKEPIMIVMELAA